MFLLSKLVLIEIILIVVSCYLVSLFWFKFLFLIVKEYIINYVV